MDSTNAAESDSWPAKFKKPGMEYWKYTYFTYEFFIFINIIAIRVLKVYSLKKKSKSAVFEGNVFTADPSSEVGKTKGGEAGWSVAEKYILFWWLLNILYEEFT